MAVLRELLQSAVHVTVELAPGRSHLLHGRQLHPRGQKPPEELRVALGEAGYCGGLVRGRRGRHASQETCRRTGYEAKRGSAFQRPRLCRSHICCDGEDPIDRCTGEVVADGRDVLLEGVSGGLSAGGAHRVDIHDSAGSTGVLGCRSGYAAGERVVRGELVEPPSRHVGLGKHRHAAGEVVVRRPPEHGFGCRGDAVPGRISNVHFSRRLRIESMDAATTQHATTAIVGPVVLQNASWHTSVSFCWDQDRESTGGVHTVLVVVVAYFAAPSSSHGSAR